MLQVIGPALESLSSACKRRDNRQIQTDEEWIECSRWQMKKILLKYV